MLALVVSRLFAFPGLALFWTDQQDRQSFYIHSGLGIVWLLAAGLVQLRINFTSNNFSSGFISVFYPARPRLHPDVVPVRGGSVPRLNRTWERTGQVSCPGIEATDQAFKGGVHRNVLFHAHVPIANLHPSAWWSEWNHIGVGRFGRCFAYPFWLAAFCACIR
jgi:hypothetical protein